MQYHMDKSLWARVLDLPGLQLLCSLWQHVSMAFSSYFISDLKVDVSVAQLCPTLCESMYCSLPGFSVPGVLQARILGWVSIPFSHIAGRFFIV